MQLLYISSQELFLLPQIDSIIKVDVLYYIIIVTCTPTYMYLVTIGLRGFQPRKLRNQSNMDLYLQVLLC